jgi:choice-of-anchor A domain-containing protein
MSGSSFIGGTLFLSPGDSFSQSGPSKIGNIVNNANLTQPIDDALATAAADAALPCTQSFTSLNLGNHATNTITGNVGVNVICVQDIVLNTATINLTGPAGAKFVLNIGGKLVLNGSSHILAGGGVQPADILYNLIGAGADVALTGGGGGANCCNSGLDGTLLAPQRKINLSPGLVNGQVISGMDISIVSGSSVRCAPSTGGCTPVTGVNTVTVNAQISEVQSNIIHACVLDSNGIPITASSQCSAAVECSSITTNPPPSCPPVTSSISSGFNGTSISTSNDIWFNANFSAKGIPFTGATIDFQNSSLKILSANGTFIYSVPDGQIVFSPSASCATTMFDGAKWITTVPLSGSDEILLSALGISAPADLKAVTVTWSGTFTASTGGISLSWKWGAAVYTTDITQAQYNNLGVKPAHSNTCVNDNSDHAGTPENVRSAVIGGARGGGGSNFTGSWSSTVSRHSVPRPAVKQQRKSGAADTRARPVLSPRLQRPSKRILAVTERDAMAMPSQPLYQSTPKEFLSRAELDVLRCSVLGSLFCTQGPNFKSGLKPVGCGESVSPRQFPV